MHVTSELSKNNVQNKALNDSFKRIGGRLKTARKARGLRLADVAQELRISNGYLKFLEAGDFDALPAPTYVSGFLRSYGGFVGLDGAALASRYSTLRGNAATTTAYSLPMTARPPQRSAPAVASVCVVLAVIAYGGWYVISGPKTPDAAVESELAVVELEGKRSETMELNATIKDFGENDGDTTAVNDAANGAVLTAGSGNAVPTAPAAVTSAMIATAMIATPTVETPQLDTATGDTAATRDAGSGNADAGNAGAGNAGVATANIANLDSDLNTSPTANTLNAAVSAVSDGSGTELTPGRTAAIAGLRDPDLEITIRAKASSWVEIVRDDGTSVVTKLMKAGETYIVDDGSTLYLSTGNAGGIELVTHDNDVIQLGAVGEIVRDLPLIKSRLKNRF